jgi:hypothetical protein
VKQQEQAGQTKAKQSKGWAWKNSWGSSDKLRAEKP